MTQCPTCGARYDDAVRFCATDGTPLVPAPPPAPFAPHPSPADVARPPGRSRRPLLVGLLAAGVLVVAVGAVTATTLLGARRIEAQAMGAIARGDLVTPARVSAYDNYQRLAGARGATAARERVAAAALPALVAAMDRLYTEWYTTAELADPGAWPRVAQMATWAVELNPADARLTARRHYALGRIAHEESRWVDAAAAYEAASAAWPEWALPHNSLAVVLARQDDFDGAIARYRTAAARDPQWSFPVANLGSLYLRLRRYREAQAALQQAVALNPQRASPHAQLAHAHAAVGDYAAAVASANEALRLDPYGRYVTNPGALRRAAEGWQVHSWYDDAGDYGYGE